MKLNGRHVAAALVALPLLLQGAQATEARLKSSVVNGPHSATIWEKGQLAYDLEAVRMGLEPTPPVFASHLPHDIAEIGDVKEKKRTFIRLVLPLILESNARIGMQRKQLTALASRPDRLSAKEREWLRDLAWQYGMDGAPRDVIGPLLLRVDIIPPSLAIAQSITESGWGTSRFAQNGRALYGQRTWNEGAGIVPKKRGAGATFEVKAFSSLMESVTAYMRNLNTHPAYAELRRARAEMRREARIIDGYVLAGGLTRYAETGQKYVNDLRALMRVNRLRDFDKNDVRIGGQRVAQAERR